jgi:hypothetical protein
LPQLNSFIGMKTASVTEIKQGLGGLPAKELAAICIRLAKYKKENKELLTYLLFEAADEPAYIESAKREMDDQFAELPKANLYLTKKSLRKILRAVNKYIRHMGSPQAEAELLVYFCAKLKRSGIPLRKSPVLTNLYERQLRKTNEAIAALHEDLQYDYIKELEQLA